MAPKEQRKTLGTQTGPIWLQWLPVGIAVAIFGILAQKLWFIQDDAYITYRYVANFVGGNGMVFNIGERIEGITNFGWTVFLSLWGSFGAPFIPISQIAGLLFGVGTIIVAFLIARLVFDQKQFLFAAVAILLVGANQSLAYWSPAGLETAAFCLFATLAIYWYLKRNHLLIWALVIAVWLRPEGAVLTGLLILTEAIVERRIPWFTIRCASLALLLSLPYVGFKLGYYGRLLPNPFYAKTTADWEHIVTGLKYAAEFFTDYGFYGAGIAIVLLCAFFTALVPREVKSLLLIFVGYTLYIIAVGGDVLKVHRFFLPLVSISAILSLFGLYLLLRSLGSFARNGILVCASIAMIALTYYLPLGTVEGYNRTEILFTTKMKFLAEEMKRTNSSNFSVALSTIGIFGYELMGHEIIDLLGLTDSTIAKYSEPEIPGMTTSWKERKHNSKYLLQRAPDYIVFSTGVKPSAPAERALFLYRQFVDSYRMRGWYYENRLVPGTGSLLVAYARTKAIEGDIVPYYPVSYVQDLKIGLDAYVAGDCKRAIQFYQKSLQECTEPKNPYLFYHIGFCYLLNSELDSAEKYFDATLIRDSAIFEAHKDLQVICSLRGDLTAANMHREWLVKLVPWYVSRQDEVVRQMVALSRQQSR